MEVVAAAVVHHDEDEEVGGSAMVKASVPTLAASHTFVGSTR